MKQYQRSKVPAGPGVHPLVNRLWQEMNDQCASQEDVAKRAGVSSSTMRKWRKGERSPRLYDLEACLNVLGLEITVTGGLGD
jgi:transcriptional regulator with XRE-family HTH domain